MKNIQAFVQETGLRFEDKGEIGFGRSCVGIVNDATESYLAYQTYDGNYDTSLIHEVAANTAPEYAYHKGPYLAVLHDGSEEGRKKAIEQLDKWIEKIMAASFEIKTYIETNSLTALMRGGSVEQKCLAGGITYGKFIEVF